MDKGGIIFFFQFFIFIHSEMICTKSHTVSKYHYNEESIYNEKKSSSLTSNA